MQHEKLQEQFHDADTAAGAAPGEKSEKYRKGEK